MTSIRIPRVIFIRFLSIVGGVRESEQLLETISKFIKHKVTEKSMCEGGGNYSCHGTPPVLRVILFSVGDKVTDRGKTKITCLLYF